MKKALAMLLCAVSMVGLLAGCGSSSNGGNGGTTEPNGGNESAAYPTGPITVIIPYSPGGGSHILTRTLMEFI